MELKHSFTVPVPLDRAWDVLLDVERVAPCMPGATLDSVDGDDITGKIKVRVGPISMIYSGKAKFTERDREAGVVTLDASGKETRGAGTASASVRSELTGDGEQTHVTVLTNLNVTGKPAQFGRGVLNEVSGKLIGIFADNLAKMLAAEPAPTAPGASADAPSLPLPAASEQAAAPGQAAPAGQARIANADTVDGSGDVLALPIEELSLPLRAYNSLRREGVHTVGDLVAQTPQQLLAIDYIGPASVDDIRQRLASRGLALTDTAGNDTAGNDTAGNDTAGSQPAGSQPASSEPAPGEATVSGSASSDSAAGDSAAADTAAGDSFASANGSGQPGTVFPTAADQTGADQTGADPAAATPLRAVPAAESEPSWQPNDDAIDLLSVAGLPVLRRALPAVAGVAAVAIIVLGIRRRRRRAGH